MKHLSILATSLITAMSAVADSNMLVQLPEVRLTNDERIVAMVIKCLPTCVVSITDIPCGWRVVRDGELTGAICVWKDAVDNAKELPGIVIRPYAEDTTQIVSVVSLQVERHPGVWAPALIAVTITNTTPQQTASPLPRDLRTVQAQDLLYTTNNGAVTITGYTGTVGNALSPRTVVEDDAPWSTTQNDILILPKTRAYLRKLAERGDVEGVEALKGAFLRNRKTITDRTAYSFVDAEILLMLEEVGGTNALAAVRDIVSRVHHDAPRYDTSFFVRYISAMRIGISILGHSGDSKSIAILQGIESDKAADSGVRSDAYPWLLADELRNSKIERVDSQVEWLCRRCLHEVGNPEFARYRRAAFENAICNYGIDAVPSLETFQRALPDDASRKDRQGFFKGLIDRIKSGPAHPVQPVPYWPYWRITNSPYAIF